MQRLHTTVNGYNKLWHYALVLQLSRSSFHLANRTVNHTVDSEARSGLLSVIAEVLVAILLVTLARNLGSQPESQTVVEHTFSIILYLRVCWKSLEMWVTQQICAYRMPYAVV